MNIRQKILKVTYPLLMRFSRMTGKASAVRGSNPGNMLPIISFYDLRAISISGKVVEMSQFRGKKILIVNLASFCGYTRQYEELQKLQEIYADKLVILGFPANNFKSQEPASNSEIAEFCKIYYGVSFPLFSKGSVLPPDQQEVYQWLTLKEFNGWNTKKPNWNFFKYLINEEGVLTHYWGSAYSPLDAELITAIKKESV